MTNEKNEHSSAVPGVEEQIEQAMSTVRRFVTGFAATAAKVAKWVQDNQEAIDKWAQIIRYYEAELSDLDATKQEAITTLRQYKWILTPWTFPILVSIPFAKIGKTSGKPQEEIDKFFVTHFTQNNSEPLEEMIQRWAETPIFESRIHIFRDCLDALRNKNDTNNPCNVVVPTLVSQIDGIMTAFMQAKGLILPNPRAGIWEDPTTGHQIRPAQKKDYFKDESYSAVMALDTELKDVAVEVIFDYLFETAFATRPAPSDFNRHKILHGEATDYGSLPNAIRAFLLLDFLAILCLKFE